MKNISPKPTVRVLVVDDDRIIAESLREFLRLENYDVESAASLPAALQILERGGVNLILCDVNMPGGNGFELLHCVRKRFSETVVVMMTGYGTIGSAVEAIKMGAYDYLTKPIVDDELKVCIERAVAQQALLRENRILKETLDLRFGLESVVGHDYRMLKVFDLVESVAPSRVTVLVQGASGTGKSMIAKVIHQRSGRGDKPFIEVSCGALPDTLLESELFGHVRGSFTGAVANKPGKFKAAHGGTLFLDEISTASPALQMKLLRVLQTHQFEPVGSNKTETVDVRVLLASNTNLDTEVKAGRFREDLYYRINVVTVEMPTLADRVGDIPLLSRHFLNQYSAEMNRLVIDFEPSAMQLLMGYSWPGNVRELENVVERGVVLCKGRHITMADLPPKLLAATASNAQQPAAIYKPMPLREALEEPEKRILEAALRANGWNRNLTAQQLVINRTTLYKKMKRYGLDSYAEPA
jgi:two-component system, NtrC family, response regulator AtoC